MVWLKVHKLSGAAFDTGEEQAAAESPATLRNMADAAFAGSVVVVAARPGRCVTVQRSSTQGGSLASHVTWTCICNPDSFASLNSGYYDSLFVGYICKSASAGGQTQNS